MEALQNEVVAICEHMGWLVPFGPKWEKHRNQHAVGLVMFDLENVALAALLSWREACGAIFA
jgi:hypothetical protein